MMYGNMFAYKLTFSTGSTDVLTGGSELKSGMLLVAED